MVLTRTAPSTGRIKPRFAASSALSNTDPVQVFGFNAAKKRDGQDRKIQSVLLHQAPILWPRRRTSRKSSSRGSFCRGPGFTVVEMDRVTHRGHQNPTNSSFCGLQKSWLELLRKQLSSLWMTRGHESGERREKNSCEKALLRDSVGLESGDLCTCSTGLLSCSGDLRGLRAYSCLLPSLSLHTSSGRASALSPTAFGL
ncbi:hypothetical protein AOLI_G00294900 [Acnodon oligacanthus]